MIKRTPQEIADFFGCYVARDADRRWHVFKEKPELNLGYYRKENTLIKIGIYLNPELINTDNVYQLAVLYEPHSGTNQQADEGMSPESGDAGSNFGNNQHPDNKGEAYYQNRPDFDNKHQYEVHAHAEYRVVSAVADTEDLDTKVNKLIAEGWRPQGGVAFMQYDDNHYDTFYQAMVRGV